MLCSISGEAPQHPVASSKSGNVYEKRLIEAYIAENHKDPVNGEELEVTDLIDLKSSRIVTPRPPTLTSIPSLLSTFQNEWDALALETFTIRQQLHQTRQELATALYQHDAAIRVIARLSKERDEAREALSQVTVGAGSGDAMEIDSKELPEALAAKVDATQEKLSKTRRKRAVPEGWPTLHDVEGYGVGSTSPHLFPGATCLALDGEGQLVLSGDSQGIVGAWSLVKNQVRESFNVGDNSAITGAAWYGSKTVVSTSSGTVRVGENEHTFTCHAGSVNGLALHPCGDILASVGVDRSFVFYDLAGGSPVTQVYTDSALTTAAFHPDGHLFAAGGLDGQIRLFHVKTGESAAEFDLGGIVQAVAFSENGIWFAAVAKGSTTVTIFDLRKAGKEAKVKELEIGGQVDSIAWDYTGQYLAASGPGGLSVWQYVKSSKSWIEVMTTAVPGVAVVWGLGAKSLITVDTEGEVNVLS